MHGAAEAGEAPRVCFGHFPGQGMVALGAEEAGLAVGAVAWDLPPLKPAPRMQRADADEALGHEAPKRVWLARNSPR